MTQSASKMAVAFIQWELFIQLQVAAHYGGHHFGRIHLQNVAAFGISQSCLWGSALNVAQVWQWDSAINLPSVCSHCPSWAWAAFYCMPWSCLIEKPRIGSKMAAPIAGRHLQLNEELWLADSFNKMAAPIACSHLQLNEELWLADSFNKMAASIAGRHLQLNEEL